MRFTDYALRRLKPRSKRYDVTETGVSSDRRGLTIRVFPSGGKAFVYRYQLKGRTRRMTLGNYPGISLQRAHREHAKASEMVRDGVDPAQVLQDARRAELEAGTVGELADEFMTRHVKRERKRPETAQQILDANVLPHWRQRKTKDIGRREVVLLLDRIVDRGAPVMANRTASLITQMFTFAVGRGLLEASPCVALERPGGKETPRQRVLSDDEIRAFWERLDGAAMSAPIRLASRLLLVTGQRRGELVAAKWSEIGDALWNIPAEHTKNGRSHVTPLSPFALELFDELHEITGTSDWLLPSPRDGHVDPHALTRAVYRNREHFGLPAFCAHDLRRSAYSGMQSLGVHQSTLDRVFNHTASGMARVYGRHDFLAEKRQALSLWAEYLRETIAVEQHRVTPFRHVAS